MGKDVQRGAQGQKQKKTFWVKAFAQGIQRPESATDYMFLYSDPAIAFGKPLGCDSYMSPLGHAATILGRSSTMGNSLPSKACGSYPMKGVCTRVREDFTKQFYIDPEDDTKRMLTFDCAICIIWTGSKLEEMNEKNFVEHLECTDKLACLMSRCRRLYSSPVDQVTYFASRTHVNINICLVTPTAVLDGGECPQWLQILHMPISNARATEIVAHGTAQKRTKKERLLDRYTRDDHNWDHTGGSYIQPQDDDHCISGCSWKYQPGSAQDQDRPSQYATMVHACTHSSPPPPHV